MAFASVMTAASEMRCLWCIYLERGRAASPEPVVGASVAGGLLPLPTLSISKWGPRRKIQVRKRPSSATLPAAGLGHGGYLRT